MDTITLDIAALGDPQQAGLEELLTATFPTEPLDLLQVEVHRASSPRLGYGLVTVQDGQVVGAVLARQPRNGSVFVVYLAVAEPHRRRGIACSLLDELTAATGHRLELFVTDGNAAEHLYRDGGLAPDQGPAPAGQRHWVGTWR